MHPSTKILLLVFIGIAMHKLSHIELLALVSLLLVLMLYFRVSEWFAMLRRMRWLFASILLVYGFSTPGEYLAFLPLDVGVTYEGLKEGVLQIVSLASMLATIAILIKTTAREDLIVGFYCLMRPLRSLGVSPERFAARLCLTLQYLEDRQNHALKTEKPWQKLLNMKIDEASMSGEPQTITLDLPVLKWFDFLVLAVLLLMAWML